MASNANGCRALVGCSLLLFILVAAFVLYWMSRLGGPDTDRDLLVRTSSEVIEQAEVLAFDLLSERERNDIPKTSSYSLSGSWGSGCCRTFDAEDGFYVRAVVNPFALALLTFYSSCGTSLSIVNCTTSEIAQKVDTTTGPSANPHALYGKYKNSWRFSSSTGEIPSTRKFAGHSAIVERFGRGRLARDTVLVGPLPERPTSMAIQIYHGLTKERTPIPEPMITLAE